MVSLVTKAETIKKKPPAKWLSKNKNLQNKIWHYPIWSFCEKTFNLQNNKDAQLQKYFLLQTSFIQALEQFSFLKIHYHLY